MKPLQACILLVLIWFLFPFCKKEVNEVFNTFTGTRATAPVTASSVRHFPQNASEAVDLNPNISVSVDSQEIVSLYSGNISVTNGFETVGGKAQLTKNGITFKPDRELKPSTVYAVHVRLIVNTSVHDSREVRYNGRLHSDVMKDTVPLELSWKFTTRGEYQYTMNRTNSWVTDFNRDGNKVVQMGEYLYSYGGWTAEPLKSYNDVYRSSGDLTQWERLEDAPWEGRHTYGIGKKDSTLFVFGGDNLSTVFDVWKTNDGINFEPVGQDLQSLLGPRLLYGACVHNSALYVMGGQSGLGEDSSLTDVWMSVNGSLWRRIAKNLPFLGKNISGSIASYNGRIWVVGGGYYRAEDSTERYTNTVYSSVDGITWRQEQNGPWLARQYADVCAWNNRLWMIAGYNEENLADIWYMTEDGEWHEFQTPPEFKPRHASGVGVYNDKLVIVCGNYHNDCWVIEKI